MQAMAAAVWERSDEVLSIEAIAASGKRVCAALRIAGRPDTVEIGIEPPEVIAYTRMPELIAYNDEIQHLVQAILVRAHRGERIALPLDLSSEVRAINGYWPVSPKQMSAVPAGDTQVARVLRVSSDDPEPGLRSIHLEVSHQPAIVVIDVRDLPRAFVRFRFAAGVHPWQLSPQERSAMADALVETLYASDPR